MKITIGFYVLLPISHFSFQIYFFEDQVTLKKKHHHNWVVDELLKKRTFIFKKEQKSHVGLVKLHNVSFEKYLKYTELILFGKPHVQY